MLAMVSIGLPMRLSLAFGAAFAAATLALPATAQPARAEQPRTADGHPDLQGLWYAASITGLQRNKKIQGLVIPPDKADETIKTLTRPGPDGVYDPDNDYFNPDQLLSVRGELRSSWLTEPADGRLPYTRLATSTLERIDALETFGFDNPEERPAWERCVSSLGHPPIMANSYVIPHQIVQTPDAIVIATEDTDGARIIHLAGPQPPQVLRSRGGYSAGRWDGDTLIVETTHVSAPDPTGVVYRGPIPLTEASRTIERFTLLAPSEILYRFTVEDPALFTAPWSAEYVLRRHPDKFHEYACHEGNYAIVNALTAARLGRQSDKAADDKRQAKEEKKAANAAE
ncbi:MAG: hypothetical protein IPO30_13295 [Hyphomonadaceae bacterium]|nr:hypothetical protein [Hyphomonadaceae bacterium]MBP9234700.1 hypothetical protein [Hyphomonadaceae bacterium]